MKNTASKILWLLIVLITISSCKKSIVDPEKDDIYTITGRLYQDCSMQPVAHQRMDLQQAYKFSLPGGPGKGGLLAETTTDENGNFRFEYKDAGGRELRIRTLYGNSFNERMLNIPERKNIENLIVYKIPTSNIIVKLNINKSYTINDTLFITDFNNLSEKMKVPGPFSSGILYIANNYNFGLMGYSGNKTDIGYKVNNSNWTIVDFDLKVCDNADVIITLN